MKAIVLFSGGMDSTVMLAKALEKGRECLALSFDYGQRHRVELKHAAEIAFRFGVEHRVLLIDLKAFANSSLLNDSQIQKGRTGKEIAEGGIPNTYVPARNTLFLAYALGQAELFNAGEIYCGANLLDRQPYPDCRPAYYDAFQHLANLATKQAVEGSPPKILTPLIEMDKTKIIKEGRRLGVPFEMTFSCYDPTPVSSPCGSCDACTLRISAFELA